MLDLKKATCLRSVAIAGGITEKTLVLIAEGKRPMPHNIELMVKEIDRQHKIKEGSLKAWRYVK